MLISKKMKQIIRLFDLILIIIKNLLKNQENKKAKNYLSPKIVKK